MKRHIVSLVAIFVMAWCWCVGYSAPDTQPSGLDLTIVDPKDGDKVDQRPTIKGTITNGKYDAEIWLVIHPTETRDYWVQPRISPANKKGEWSASVHIGRPGGIDSGKSFEIMALANPTEKLEEGKYGKEQWPTGEARSDVVRITLR